MGVNIENRERLENKMNDGRYGELLFQQIMENKGYKVEDVTEDPQYQDKDIDFIVTSPTSGEVKTFEVKWDYKINRTNNLFLEVANSHSTRGIGWWEFCKADYLAYGDAHSRIFYIFSLLELRERVNTLRKEYTNCRDESIGQLVNLRDVQDIYKILS